MPLKRGFKSYANGRADEFRLELGLQAMARFDPFEAAKFLSIPVLAFGNLTSRDPEAIALLRDGNAVSAITVFAGHRRCIVYNDAHSPGRTNNNLAHEVAHAILLHAPGPALGVHGCRLIDRDAEGEADFLGGALLLPEAICLSSARAALTDEEIADRYVVSRDLATYRMNITGARKRAVRGRQYLVNRVLAKARP